MPNHITENIWWHWQNLNKDNGKPWWQHSRAWLHWGERQAFGAEWSIPSRHAGIEARFCDSAVGDDAITLFCGIGLAAAWLHVERASWVERLPGVRWESGKYDDGEREIGIKFFDNALWLYLWSGDGKKRRVKRIGFLDTLLGRQKYSTQEIKSGTVTVQMPEGDYEATYKLYHAYWKRPRWPWPVHVQRGEIKVENGVPIPGKGTTAYNIGEDAIYSMTTPARSLPDLVAKFTADIVETRLKYGGERWRSKEWTP